MGGFPSSSSWPLRGAACKRIELGSRGASWTKRCVLSRVLFVFYVSSPDTEKSVS